MDINFKEEFLEIAIEFEKSPLVTFGPGKGSLSARDFLSGEIIITPSGMKFSKLSTNDLIEIDSSGTMISKPHKPSLDLIFHLAVYKARSDVGGIIHTHSPYATAFSCMSKKVEPMILSLALMVGGSVDVSPFAFPGTQELGDSIVQGLGKKNATLMEKHGVLAVGKNLARALAVASTVENVAQIQAAVMSMGKIEPLSEEVVRRGIEFESGYGQSSGK